MRGKNTCLAVGTSPLKMLSLNIKAFDCIAFNFSSLSVRAVFQACRSGLKSIEFVIAIASTRWYPAKYLFTHCIFANWFIER